MVSKLACRHCSTKLEGEFVTSKFCQLPDDQLEFIEVFIKCRGNIKDVEKELGISYPTVRSRLEAVIEALGYRKEDVKASEKIKDHKRNEESVKQRQEILQTLENGDISAQEAAERLKKLKENAR